MRNACAGTLSRTPILSVTSRPHHRPRREGLARLLADAGHEIVGLAPDAPSLMTVVAQTSSELAVIDVRMPPDYTDDGARAARRLRVLNPELGIVLQHRRVLAVLAYLGGH